MGIYYREREGFSGADNNFWKVLVVGHLRLAGASIYRDVICMTH